MHADFSQGIHLTKKAALQLRALFMLQDQRGLRFADTLSKCGEGYSYVIDLVSSPQPTDRIFYSQGIPIFIPQSSLPRLHNTVIDSLCDTLPSGKLIDHWKTFLDIKNPHAQGECPCSCGDGHGIKTV